MVNPFPGDVFNPTGCHLRCVLGGGPPTAETGPGRVGLAAGAPRTAALLPARLLRRRSGSTGRCHEDGPRAPVAPQGVTSDEKGERTAMGTHGGDPINLEAESL